jgi:hypothetical protein
MRCRAKIHENEKCQHKAKVKYLFLVCHTHKVQFKECFCNLLKSNGCKFIKWLITTIAGGVVTYFIVDRVIENRQPFTAIVHITDWIDRDNEEIYNKGGVIIFDNKYTQPMNEIGTVNFPDLPSSYIGNDIQIKFKPKQEYGFMFLDTIIKIERNKTYSLKMYFKGIDKITRKLIDKNGEPIIGAVSEIKGEKDTTNSDGIFTITLPPEKQELIQMLTIKKEGYQDYIRKSFNVTVYNTLKMEKQ